MDPVVLTRGANHQLALDSRRLHVLVSWPNGDTDLDASALLLASRRVRSDEDFVFYNQPASAEGAVLHCGRSQSETGTTERLTIDLNTIDPAVETIAITASTSTGTLADASRIHVRISDGNTPPYVEYGVDDFDSEAAGVLAEIYRRDESWKVRAVGQGWATGLAGLATDFGVVVDDGAGDAADAPQTPDASDAPPTPPDEAPTGKTLDPLPVEERPSPAKGPRGVRTRKRQRPTITAPERRLAGDDSWVPARLFSVYGVGSGEEQEKRTTSALLSTMMSVKAFARAISAHLGAPAGTIETFIEVPFALDDRTVIPDGVIRCQRAGRMWTALVEVKTGSGQLRREQVEDYLGVAKDQGYDAVVTISNEIAPQPGEHPLTIDRRRTRTVDLFHMSWAEVLHESRMVLSHHGVRDPHEAWILSELIRYLDHPRSGATGFEDMGTSWVPVREAVAAGTLRAGDRKVPAVATSWTRLVRHLCLRLTAELGVRVRDSLPRQLANDSKARTNAIVEQLATDGTMSATLKVPGAAGTVRVVADLRTTRVQVSTLVPSPQEGGPTRRVSWLLRQLRTAPDDTLVDVHFAGDVPDTCERLGDVRDNPGALIPDRSVVVESFELTTMAPMGTKRSGVKGAFIPSIVQTTESFYAGVLQPLKGWVAPAPAIAEAPEPKPGEG